MRKCQGRNDIGDEGERRKDIVIVYSLYYFGLEVKKKGERRGIKLNFPCISNKNNGYKSSLL